MDRKESRRLDKFAQYAVAATTSIKDAGVHLENSDKHKDEYN
jgi:3-oxoacyl-[acyl-carrier-protein] synthase II